MPHENNSALAFVLIGEVHSHPEGIEDTTPRSSRLPIYPVSKRALLTAEIDMSREAAVTEMGGRRVPHDSSCHWLAHSITAINKTAIHLIPPANDRLLHRDLLSISRPWAGKLLEYVMESEEERSAAEEGDCCSWMDARGGRRRKRFSEEQIKSLETMFETQTKLDPRQKLQLARELDLQPRQVAIWFQNKRARWKAKQLEREFRALKSAYDALLSSFESLKKEKQVLINQLQDLAELLEKSERSDEEKRTTASLKEEPEFEFTVYEDGKKLSYLSEDKHVLCTGQLANSSLTSSAEEQQFCFTTGWPSDQSCSNSQWWEFCL